MDGSDTVLKQNEEIFTMKLIDEIKSIAERADRLARDLPRIKADPATAGYLRRIGTQLRDLHTAITVATTSVSPQLREHLPKPV